jgi:catechol 2,3-dioxygenase-like lactoylglutathione lyase family enzyme
MTRRIVLLATLLISVLTYAQTPPPIAPNAEGVSWLHIHLRVRDVDAQRAFWLALTGDPPPTGRGLRVGGLPVSIELSETAQSSDGSAIDYVAFRVRDLKGTLARLEASGGRVLAGAGAGAAFIVAPEGIKVELIADSSLDVPLLHDYIRLALPSAREAQAWYAKTLGAAPNPAGDGWVIPGVVLRVTEGQPRATSKGRSLDHIAFSVENLDEFCGRLSAMGISTEPVTRIGNGTRGYTYMTDPWGVYIELMGAVAPPAN